MRLSSIREGQMLQITLPPHCFQISEREGDLQTAIDLYLKANLGAHAARVLLSSTQLLASEDLVQKVAITLVRAELFEKVFPHISSLRLTSIVGSWVSTRVIQRRKKTKGEYDSQTNIFYEFLRTETLRLSCFLSPEKNRA